MNKKQIIAAVVAAAIFIVIGISSVMSNAVSKSMSKELLNTTQAELEKKLSGGVTLDPPDKEYIGVVSVEGTIGQQTTTTSISGTATYQHNTMMEFIDSMMTDDQNKGILLYVDSPGGAVYEAEELYHKIVEYQETTKRPVWTYMAHYAASGGYFVTASADKIYANQNTTTGSIGVIISGYDLTGLYEKLGIKQVSIVSGVNKDSSTLNEEQMQIYQTIVNEDYERFVKVVADGRDMTTDEVKTLADGRIYSATQAVNNGLVDEIASYEDMKAAMEKELGCDEIYQPTTTTDIWGTIFSKVSDLKPKSEAEILTDLTSQFGSGVPMYYAEQLQ